MMATIQNVEIYKGDIMVVLQKGQPIPNTGFVRKFDLGYARRKEDFEDGDEIHLGNYMCF